MIKFNIKNEDKTIIKTYFLNEALLNSLSFSKLDNI